MSVLKSGDFPGVSDNGVNFLVTLASELAQLKLAVNQLLTDYNAHVHGGITAGAASSAAPTASSAAAVAATDTTDTNLTSPPT